MMAEVKRDKCVICDKRPVKPGERFCGNCQQKMDAQRRPAAKPWRYVAYRGNVVAFFHNGNGTSRPELVRKSVERLPKGITINLDTYCDGFTREQVKHMKAIVARLAHVTIIKETPPEAPVKSNKNNKGVNRAKVTVTVGS